MILTQQGVLWACWPGCFLPGLGEKEKLLLLRDFLKLSPWGVFSCRVLQHPSAGLYGQSLPSFCNCLPQEALPAFFSGVGSPPWGVSSSSLQDTSK